MIFQSPLRWPHGVSRTKSPTPSAFSMSPDKIRKGLESEVRALGASAPLLTCNLKVRQDGKPYATDRGMLHDAGVALYFFYRGQQRCMACDRYETVYDNLHAVELTIGALRGIDRWGSSEMQARAFQGFVALPPPSEPWWEVLKVGPETPLEVVEAAYKTLARKSHPDAGGSEELMAKLNRAVADARAVAS